METDVTQSVIGWIKSVQKTAEPVEISADTAVAEQKLLDSLQIMDLVMFLETNYHISIPLDALTETNFSSPRAISAMVEGLMDSN